MGEHHCDHLYRCPYPIVLKGIVASWLALLLLGSQVLLLANRAVGNNVSQESCSECTHLGDDGDSGGDGVWYRCSSQYVSIFNSCCCHDDDSDGRIVAIIRGSCPEYLEGAHTGNPNPSLSIHLRLTKGS